MATFKPLSQINQFFKLVPEKTLCGLDQLVWFHLFNKFNQAHWAETILVGDTELLELIGWYDKTGVPTSLDSIKKAKARLKKKGLIDFKSGKGNKVTEYRLIRLYPPDTPTDTPSETPPDTGQISYSRVRVQDVEDVKDKGADAGAKCRKSVAEATVPNADTYAQAKPLSSPTSDVDANRIHDEWVKGFGKSLQGNQALELEELAKKDYARAQVAIARAKANKATNPFAYFKAVYSKLTPEEVAKQTPKPKTTNAARVAEMFSDIAAQMALTGQRRD